MEAIQRTRAELRCVVPCQVDAAIISRFGNRRFNPYTVRNVFQKELVQGTALAHRQFSAKGVLFDCMGKFCDVQPRKQYVQLRL